MEETGQKTGPWVLFALINFTLVAIDLFVSLDDTLPDLFLLAFFISFNFWWYGKYYRPLTAEEKEALFRPSSPVRPILIMTAAGWILYFVLQAAAFFRA